MSSWKTEGLIPVGWHSMGDRSIQWAGILWKLDYPLDVCDEAGSSGSEQVTVVLSFMSDLKLAR